VLLILPIVVLAADYDAGYCDACGNSTEGRSSNTYNLLNSFNAALGAGNIISPGKTIRVRGGDGSDAEYRKLNNLSSLKWQCASGCGPGDDAPWFAPRLDGNVGGGSGGEGTGGSGGGGNGGGGIGPVVVAATVCGAGVCRTEWIVIGYQPI
jgi:hypothetical protein